MGIAPSGCQPCKIAFFDLDGTVASTNVVRRYAFFAQNLPSRIRAAAKYAKLLASVPFWIAVDCYSRRLFNEMFYREYRGMRKEWLEAHAERLFEKEIGPRIYPGARTALELDREAGYRLALVTGGLDFEMRPVVRHLGFDDLICNSLIFENGTATGEVRPPLIAGKVKVKAMRQLCREYNVDTAKVKAYSDSFSDLPMLEAAAFPSAVNPDHRLRREARARRWPVVDWRHAERERRRKDVHGSTD